MTFLNFSQLPKSVFRLNFQKNTFMETKPNFSLTGKCFLLTNFSNGKQTQEKFRKWFLENHSSSNQHNLIELLCKRLSILFISDSIMDLVSVKKI